MKSALGPTAGPISDDGWSMVGFLDKEDEARPGHLMGTEKWAAVYLASTPEQAALMGLRSFFSFDVSLVTTVSKG